MYANYDNDLLLPVQRRSCMPSCETLCKLSGIVGLIGIVVLGVLMQQHVGYLAHMGTAAGEYTAYALWGVAAGIVVLAVALKACSCRKNRQKGFEESIEPITSQENEVKVPTEATWRRAVTPQRSRPVQQSRPLPRPPSGYYSD